MKEKKSQVVLVIALGVLLMLGTVGTTLVLSGKLPEASALFGGGYKNVTLTDAYVICEDEIRDEFGDSLKTFAMDDHSSRHDARAKRFKIFASAQIYTSAGKGAKADEYFINCFVRDDTGSVSSFDYAKDDDVSHAPDTGGNPFGFPR